MCPQLKKVLIEKLSQYKSLKVPSEDLIKKKKKLLDQAQKIDDEIRKIVVKEENIIPFLQQGRFIRIKTNK